MGAVSLSLKTGCITFRTSAASAIVPVLILILFDLSSPAVQISRALIPAALEFRGPRPAKPGETCLKHLSERIPALSYWLMDFASLF
jgi:hypothetical protein